MAQETEETTGGLWNFGEYFLDLQGPPNVPYKFLKNTRWENYRNILGYYALSGTLNQGLATVEFNYEHLCWVEVRYQ